MVQIQIGKRRGLVTGFMWGLVITGIMIFLTMMIIALIYINTDPITATTYLVFLFFPHYMAIGWNFALVISVVPLTRRGGICNPSILTLITYAMALVFDIVAAVFYGILGWSKCIPDTGDVIQDVICSDNQWIVWYLFAMCLVMTLHAIVGTGTFIADSALSRIPKDANSSTAFDPDDPGDLANESVNRLFDSGNTPGSTSNFSRRPLYNARGGKK